MLCPGGVNAREAVFATWRIGLDSNDFSSKENIFNSKNGYFTMHRTWKNLTNVARHVRSENIGLMLHTPSIYYWHTNVDL